MSIRLFERSQLHAMPWKNGGGGTCEIACHPQQASMQDFDWRISIAHISSDGDFSVFSGVDRVITLLEGAGVQLSSPNGLIDHLLDSPGSPFAFSGDAPVHARLLGRDCHDLNVMTRRNVCQAVVSVLRAGEQISPAPAGFLFAQQGHWQLHTGAADKKEAHQFFLAPQTGLWWTEDSLTWTCQRTNDNAEAGAALLIALIYPTAR